MLHLKLTTFIIIVFMLIAFCCSGLGSKQPVLKAELPLHLEEQIDAASIIGSEVPEDIPAAVEWRFDEPQPEWKPVITRNPDREPPKVTQTEDAMRVTMTEGSRLPYGELVGFIYVDLPDLKREEWEYILVRARTSSEFTLFWITYNLIEGSQKKDERRSPFRFWGERSGIIQDGSVQTYLLKADWSYRKWEGPWQQLGLGFLSDEPGSIDILSVMIIPKAAIYADAPAGVRTVDINNAYRRALYIHAPGCLEYHIQIPEEGRLDFGLGVLRKDIATTFRITSNPEKGEKEILFEETYDDHEHWAQRSVDLSHLAGRKTILALEAEARQPGTVALWSAPTLSGIRRSEKPNIILYIIDAAGADFMSLYGYNRPNTPNLERLASEGVVFEHAYSNSTNTSASNPSFMTSLHHSVLRGTKTRRDPVPVQALTMGQHFHRAGYQTAVFTSNPNAGSLGNFQREVDVFRDHGVRNQSTSSVDLHNDFWKWRDDFPGEPYWVHFQTTDVHHPYNPAAPFSGLFVSPERQKKFREWVNKLDEVEISSATSISDRYNKRLDKTGIDREVFYNTVRNLYDETMAHQDYQLGQLVERIKAKGEWERTLLIIASDHGHPAGSFAPFGRGLIDPPVREWEGAILSSFKTRIPMMFIWPGHIAGGQRFTQQVSMIDLLPTVLDLVDLPAPEIMQGQSLAPLLLGKKGWEQRPVIFDEFYVDQKTGDLIGNIEVIDGRWGASLEIAPPPKEEDTLQRRRYQAPATPIFSPHEFPNIPRLLLYDLWNDHYATHNINRERPDLVEKYTKFLENKWREHRALAKRFSREEKTHLTPEQIRTLRSLGYIK